MQGTEKVRKYVLDSTNPASHVTSVSSTCNPASYPYHQPPISFPQYPHPLRIWCSSCNRSMLRKPPHTKDARTVRQANLAESFPAFYYFNSSRRFLGCEGLCTSPQFNRRCNVRQKRRSSFHESLTLQLRSISNEATEPFSTTSVTCQPVTELKISDLWVWLQPNLDERNGLIERCVSRTLNAVLRVWHVVSILLILKSRQYRLLEFWQMSLKPWICPAFSILCCSQCV